MQQAHLDKKEENMNINFALEQFKQNLLNIINNCNLPIGVAYLIVKDIYISLEREYFKILKIEEQETEQAVVLEIKND